MKTRLKAAALLVWFGVLVALSPAPHVHHGKDYTPITTNSKLEQDQALGKAIPEQGTVDLSPRQAPQAHEETDDNAAQTVSASQNMHKNDESAAMVIKAAEKNIEESKRGPLKSLIWVLIAGCFGYGAFFAFRKWADKTIPESSAINE